MNRATTWMLAALIFAASVPMAAGFAVATCGDEVVEPAEDCDDGNTAAGDCCSPTCSFEALGAACGLGDPCATVAQCDGAGTCVAVACDTGKPCGAICGTDLVCQGPRAGACECLPLDSCDCCATNPTTLTFTTLDGVGACGSLRNFRCSNNANAACSDDSDCDEGPCGLTVPNLCGDLSPSIACTSDADCLGTCDELPLLHKECEGGPDALEECVDDSECTNDPACPGGICTCVPGFSLRCGSLYNGGGGSTLEPSVLAGGNASISKVVACLSETLVLGPTTEADTGSLKTCTSTGCLFGQPVPNPHPTTPFSTCIVSRLAADLSGTVACNGESELGLMLDSQPYLSGDLFKAVTPPDIPGIQPCPLCVRQCVGGANDRFPCMDPSDCESNNCGSDTECLGGENDGSSCSAGGLGGSAFPTSTDCPPLDATSVEPILTSVTLTTGQVVKDALDLYSSSGDSGAERVFCGFCRDNLGTGGKCFEGDTRGSCPPANPPASGTPVPCNTDADCDDGDEYESCAQRTSGAFGIDGSEATRISLNGSTDGQCLSDGGAHTGTLVGVTCVPPTFDAGADGIADLPGPAAFAVPGEVLVDNNFCGDDEVNQPSEVCDGTDDAACPGQCQADCQCPCDCCASSPTTLTFTAESAGGTCGALRSLRCSNYALSACTGDDSCDFGTCLLPAGLCLGNLSVACVDDSDCQGTCGEVVGSGLPKLLGCGAEYAGGGSSALPQPAPLPGTAISVLNVTACNGTTEVITLGPSTETETGSLESCTSAGCLFGPPQPVLAGVLSTCVINEIAADVSAAATCDGELDLDVPLDRRNFVTGDLLQGGGGLPDVPGVQPCPLCVRQCVGGANDRYPCEDASDCSSGVCSAATQCLGGGNDGATCLAGGSGSNAFPTSADCPPAGLPTSEFADSVTFTTDQTVRDAPDLNNGTGGHRVFCGFCRDNFGAGTLCFEGDPRTQGQGACPPSAVSGVAVSCNTDADCDDGDEYESCAQGTSGAFARGNATRIEVSGSPAQCLADGEEHAVDLASLFCIPPTFAGVDTTSDLPGPGVTTLHGGARLQ